MAHKHLHEILKEDQEPFLLNNYISDRRCQLNKPTLQSNKPIIQNSISKPSRLCKQACFFSFTDSPDLRKSAILDFPATAKSPCTCTSTSTESVLLQIPSRTATLLLESAMRIQKQSLSSKPKTQFGNLGFGLFGCIFKRLLTGKNRSRKLEIAGDEDWVSPRKSVGNREKLQENVVKDILDKSFACSFSNNRSNSVVCSESNEEKTMDLETAGYCRSEKEIEHTIKERENEGFGFHDKHICSCSSSSGHRVPDFLSPMTSPIHHNKQENCEVETIQKISIEEEEVEKEQCSPVSILEPPFEDDDDAGHEDGDEYGYNLECSFAIIQRAKQQLLDKISRFEKLAELDPIELEKRMLEEQEDEDDNEGLEEEEECRDYNSLRLHSRSNVDGLFRKILHFSKSKDKKRLVSDIVAEEREEVESNTINMMVGLEFRRELDRWKRDDQEHVGGIATEIELSIFELLVEELSEAFVWLTDL